VLTKTWKMRAAAFFDVADTSQPSSLPDTERFSGLRDENEAPMDDGFPNPEKFHIHHSSSLRSSHAATQRKIMDSTQELTQPNTDRSYEERLRRPSPSCESTFRLPHSAEAPTSPIRNAALGEDGTGVVQFDFARFGETDETVSPAQDDSGFVDLGGPAHLRCTDPQSATQSPSAPIRFPETPLGPQNPFRNSRSQLLPMSQLFQATQFTSPAKIASPTSSRPSPADFPAHAISSNPPISSPLKARGLRSSPPQNAASSPQVLPGTTSPRANEKVNSPSPSSTQNPVVPESPHDAFPRKKGTPEPMSTCEPVVRSQEEWLIAEAPTNPIASDEDDVVYDSYAKKRMIQAKKDAALKQLSAISITRPRKRDDDVEVPATSLRKKNSPADSKKSRSRRKAVEKSDDKTPANGKETREDCPLRAHKVANEDDATQSNAEEEPEIVTESVPSSTAAVLPRSSKSTTRLPIGSGKLASNGGAIPETSPAGTHIDPRQGGPSVSSPTLKDGLAPNHGSSPPALDTETRHTAAEDATSIPTVNPRNSETTPHPPSSDGPSALTQATASPTRSTGVASSSPVVVQRRRREARKKAPAPQSVSSEKLRRSVRSTRLSSESTDELTRPSAVPTFEQSVRTSRLDAVKSGPGVERVKPTQPHKDRGLFEGMAFAISFQSKKPGETSEQYNTRMELSTSIQKRIKQAGGRILENGFDELFEPVPLIASTSSGSGSSSEPNLTLTAEGNSTGFTALIADGHSRKVKYMQALALGLPCIAVRWVTTCLDRGTLVDWAPYLLCAGQSSFLGDAIRSRTLVPYDTATARLSTVIAQRDKLLDGSRILAVVKKSQESKKSAYVFLAKVLGASLRRVYTLDEARVEMKAAEEAGTPYDWVYVDGKQDEEALFSGEVSAAAGAAATTGNSRGGKKRKRASAASSVISSAVTERPPKRIRALSDELVIQSLILGRIIEEGELVE